MGEWGWERGGEGWDEWGGRVVSGVGEWGDE